MKLKEKILRLRCAALRMTVGIVFVLCGSSTVYAEGVCHYVDHVPDANVAYRADPTMPPATLDASPFSVPDRIQIPFRIDVAEFAGIVNPAGAEMQAEIGLIEVDMATGEMYYNGQNITTKIQDYCKQKDEPINAQE